MTWWLMLRPSRIIFGQHGVMVLNRDDPAVMAMLSTAGSPCAAPFGAGTRSGKRGGE